MVYKGSKGLITSCHFSRSKFTYRKTKERSIKIKIGNTWVRTSPTSVCLIFYEDVWSSKLQRLILKFRLKNGLFLVYYHEKNCSNSKSICLDGVESEKLRIKIYYLLSVRSGMNGESRDGLSGLDGLACMEKVDRSELNGTDRASPRRHRGGRLRPSKQTRV